MSRPPSVGTRISARHIRLTAAGDIRGGATGKEFLSNLLLDGNEDWSKWCHPEAERSWVVAEFTRPYLLSAVGLCSANDAPRRDPASFDLFGRSEDAEWHVIATVSSCPFTNRWEWVWYRTPSALAAVPLTAVRLEVRRVRDEGNGVQLGHLHLYGVACGPCPVLVEESVRARPGCVGTAPEYARAVAGVCVCPALLATSPVRDAVHRLAAMESEVEHEDVFALVVQRGFGVPSPGDARRHVATVPPVVADSAPSGGSLTLCVFKDMCAFYEALDWEQGIVVTALALLAERESSGVLASLAGQMAATASASPAHRTLVFNRILTHVSRAIVSAAATRAFSATPSAGMSEVALAVTRIRAAATGVIDDTITHAMASTFMEPAAAYCDRARDASVMADLDVRGMSTCTAALQAATGIVTSRLPAWVDEATGMIDFLSARLEGVIASLWAPNALGVPYRSLPGVMDALRAAPCRYVPSHRFLWPGEQSTLSYARCVADPSPANAPRRAALLPYLTHFASYLTQEALLPRLFTALLSGGCGDVATLARDLAVVGASVGLAGGDVRAMVGDPAAASFNVTAARVLMDVCGVTCPAGACVALPPPLKPAPALRPPPSSLSPCIPTDAIALTAAGDIRGGATGREFLANLLADGTEPWCKWVHPDTDSTWVMAEFSSPYLLASIGLCSANDAPHRDPAVFTLKARGVGGEWTTFASVTSCPFNNRWEWVWYHAPAGVATVGITAVRLEVRRVRDEGNGVQLGHLHLRGSVAPLPAPVLPSASIRLSAAGCARGGSTGKEYLANLLNDGTEPWNKWLHPGAATSWVLAEFSRPYLLTAIGLCSANDAPHRDPACFDLRGRLMRGDWVTLASVGTCPWTNRWEWVWFALPAEFASVPLTGVRLDVKGVVKPGNGLQLGHLRCRGSPVAV